MTNTLNTPAEAIEMQYPLRVRRFERATGSGGAGKHRGGDGIVRELEALTPAEGTVITDRRISRPYGLSGGSAGQLRRELGRTNQARRRQGEDQAFAAATCCESSRPAAAGGADDFAFMSMSS